MGCKELDTTSQLNNKTKIKRETLNKKTVKFKKYKANQWEMIYPANSKNIKVGVTILISDIYYKINTP